ncbi:MAG: LytTR family DNA-binding domain-containing protein [Lachnospiraceae bacterium]|nr:LytTR family DNA-binding domain-containing protein [Robinsoniella sp.]MDY3766946.1 LytTR family DNA-binding domain-containing protein [Lachnospiraceae bacterium]
MKSISIAICEDNYSSLSYIEQSVQKFLSSRGYHGVISSYSSSFNLYSLIQEGIRFGLYFLDIDMPKVNGLTLAATIRSLDESAVIMFVSAKEEYVFDAIKVQPFRFIRKSHFQSDLSEALEEYLRQNQEEKEDTVITIEVQNEIYRFSVSDILYIQAKDNYLDIITAKKNTLIRYKISDMEKLLEPYQFLRIHKSYLVNYRYIFSLQGKTVTLEDGTQLPISRYRLSEVQEKFKECIYNAVKSDNL